MKLKTSTHCLLLIAMIVALGGAAAAPAQQASNSTCYPDRLQSSGAVYRICMPANTTWNGDLVVYAHGYVAFNEPIVIPEDQLAVAGEFSIPETINGLGYAFATTSYSINGLAVKQSSSDLLELVDIFSNAFAPPSHVYLVGPSEGGLITALMIEQHADVFDGGIAACGPIGNFNSQINYWGDVRVLFDYFFPGLLPGSPIDIPVEVIENWEAIHKPQIEAALRANPEKMRLLLKVGRVPVNPLDSESGIQALLQLLWYNVFATNDGIDKLGGQPYDNSKRWYAGSPNDLLLNLSVPRFRIEPNALAEINAFYQTSGKLSIPLVTLHTLGDPVVPQWHQALYTQKALATGSQPLYTAITTLGYGHCAFKEAEIVAAFAIMVYRVTGKLPLNVSAVLSQPAELQAYSNLIRVHLSGQ